jgi:hypothetical protein
MDRVLDALDAVVDEETFVRFLKVLAEDRADEVEKEKQNPSSPYGPGANGWENGSIEAFLDAAAAWAEDLPDPSPMMVNGISVAGYTKPDNPWTRCADIIYAGKFYE